MSKFNFDFDATADEDFFGNLRSKSSKLQQLLDEDTLPEAEKQQSLKYQRPKATDLKSTLKNETSPSSSVAVPSAGCTLIAKVATAYRQVQLQGKVGVALVKTTEDNLSMVIYKSKEVVLATLQLHSDKQTLFRQQRYWQFYADTTEVDWSFCFDAPEDEVEFQDLLLKNGQTFQEAVINKKEKEIRQEVVEVAKDLNTKELKHEDSSGLSKTLTCLEAEKARDSARTTLIKRMAKMGQPLPNLSTTSMQTTTEFSDSSDTEVIKTPVFLPQQKPSIAPRCSKLATLKANQKQVVPSSMAINAAPVYSNISNNLESQYMQMLLTEQRTQGSELRMNVQKLETKIEKVLDKLDDFNRGGIGGSEQKKHKDDEILELEEKILNLKKENRKLKQMIEAQNDSYEVKSKEVLSKLKDDLMEMNIESNDFEKTINKCLQSLQDKQNTIEKLQESVENLQEKKKEIENDLEKQKENNTTLENQVQELNEKNVRHKTQLDEKDKELKSMEQRIVQLQQDLKDKSKEHHQPTMDDVVKSIMNNLYADISSKITPSDCSDMEKVLSLVGLSIKQQTLKALQQQKPKDDYYYF